MKAEANKKTKKIIIGVLSVCLVAVLGIGGTLAFLTDTEQITNNFSVGDLDITIDEPQWDDDGDGDGDADNEDDDDDEDNGDGRNLVPGDTREKDPTIHAVKGDSYMRAVVQIKDMDGEIITDTERLDLILFTIRYDAARDEINEGTGYTIEQVKDYPRVNPDFTLDTVRSSDGQYFYNYSKIFHEGESVVLFTDIVIPCEWTQEELDILGEYQIVIQAQAIQSANFTDSAAAFTALDGEISDGTADQNYETVGGGSDKEFVVAESNMTV
ncbi:MAG: hypothetical protein J1E39_09335 [Eubacterium sp.]|nr:hypothetical protein [Eubacterium sp.]